MDALTKFAAPSVLFLLTVAFGFWLSSLGKPYNGFLFNIHKLIALGAVVLMVLQLAKTLKGLDLIALTVTLLLVAAGCVVSLFASGALMSLGKLDYALVLTVHRIAVGALVIALVLSAYLLIGKKL